MHVHWYIGTRSSFYSKPLYTVKPDRNSDIHVNDIIENDLFWHKYLHVCYYNQSYVVYMQSTVLIVSWLHACICAVKLTYHLVISYCIYVGNCY